MPYKIFSVVGARPQFIKAGPVSHALEKAGFNEIILHTGQHFDHAMSEIFFKELGIKAPQYNLNIHGGTHGQMTARMLEGIEATLMKEKPDIVLIYGDTNSTLAGALAAAKLNIPVVHVEAGLRSFNRAMPEELNRVTSDHLSSLLLCPTYQSVENLKREGIVENVVHVGDVMYDACLNVMKKLTKPETDRPYALLTLHRQSTTENPEAFEQALAYAIDTAQAYKLDIIFPVHPRTRKILDALPVKPASLICKEPLGYIEMQSYIGGASLIMTDSGGLQKEAYFHKIPCITLRSETEWKETVTAGWNRLWTEQAWASPRQEIAEYGHGNTAELIAQNIQTFLK